MNLNYYIWCNMGNKVYKFGYIGVIGKTNAGKSTLINLIVGNKVAIVSPKTQTTRNNILGIITKFSETENYQLVFVDTPGIHKSQNNLDKQMNKNLRTAISSVDIILYVLDSSKNITQDELEYIKNLNKIPLILVINKIDKISKLKLIETINLFKNYSNINSIIPFSSTKNINLNILLSEILKLLPISNVLNFIFNEDEYTDQSLKFLISEIIREKTLYLLHEEIPHGIAVSIKEFKENEKIVEISADIICEKQSHKNIIIGKNGSKIKEISSKARLDIEDLLQKKVMLTTYVKVIKNWRNLINPESILE